MLDCKGDRLDYGEQLRPPSGYKFDRAVATTYSANLATLLSIPVALVYAQTMEGDLTGARFQLLEAIKQFSSRVRVYHQAGQLLVPAKLNWLYAHLEDALVPILPDNAFTAFHPKIWIIRYTPEVEEGEGNADANQPNRFRIIVLSRNLTFDRSWDVAASLEGEMGSAIVAANRPLVDFVGWLHEQQPIPWIESFLHELERVEFRSPHPFESHVFHPMGIRGYKGSPLEGLKSNRTVVLSPFLDPTTIESINKQTRSKLNLFSEAYELAKLPVELLEKIESYHLSDLIVDGESIEAAEEGATDIQKQTLHAKVFVMRVEGENRWFLGSANATKAARERNVEFMLELNGATAKSRIWRLLNELIGEKEDQGPFVRFSPDAGGKFDAENAKQQTAARKFEYAILKSKVEAWLEPSENGKNFDLHIDMDLSGVPTMSHLKVAVLPFNVRSKPDPASLEPGQKQSFVFSNIGEVELSRFLHFRIEDSEDQATHEFLLRIEISNLPADRLDNILRKIIDSRDKFFEYLRFLLADEITKEDLLSVGDEESPSPLADEEGVNGWQVDLPIYEQLLVVASRSPSKLADVDEVIQHLVSRNGAEEEEEFKSVIPEAFLSFWEAFRGLIPAQKNKPD